jgi:hypothetical protein
VYYKAASSTTWTLAYTSPTYTITGTSTSDSRYYDIAPGSGCSLWDYKVEIYRSGQASYDYVRSDANDADLNDHKEESYADDNCAPVATVYDAWWTQADNDGDGCKAPTTSTGGLRLNWDADVSCGTGSLTVYAKVYYKAASSTTWTLAYTSPTYTITGTSTSDSRYYDIAPGSGCLEWDYKVEIYRSGQTVPDYTRSDANDSDLNNHREETYPQDTPPCTTLATPSPTAPACGSTVGSTSVTVSWTDVANESGYVVRLFSGGSCSALIYTSPELPANTTSFALTGVGLQNGQSYSWQVQAKGNGTTYCDSGWSACCSFSTPATTRTLTVNSSPCSGVSVGVSPNDNSGQGSGATSFTRTYNNGVTVTLTAPTSGCSGTFQKWQRNGVDYSTSASTTVTMDANYTMTVVYGTPTCHGTATRSLPSCYPLGSPVSVTNSVTPDSSGGVYAVEDAPPTDWTVTNISHSGTWDSVNKKVKWGPFFDNTPRALSYVATPPAGATGQKCFSGTVSFDGGICPIGGPACIDKCIATPHPADNNPQDWRISIAEVTAYGNCWKTGCTWPNPPNPVPIEYVTRAGYLWKNGEVYHYDPAQACPSCWVPGATSITAMALAAASVPAEYVVAASVTSRALPSCYTPSAAVAVTVTVTPDSAVGVYAVEDAPPTGWTVANISNSGTWDDVNKKVKWGPFFDNTPRTLTYQATPPANASGTKSFAGIASFDGSNAPIGGTADIVPCSTCSVTGTVTGSPIPATGGSGSVSITATASNCSWTVSKDAAWLSFTDPVSGFGSATVAFTVGANTSTNSRTAQIVVGSTTNTLVQQGAQASGDEVGVWAVKTGLSGVVQDGNIVGKVKIASPDLVNVALGREIGAVVPTNQVLVLAADCSMSNLWLIVYDASTGSNLTTVAESIDIALVTEAVKKVGSFAALMQVNVAGSATNSLTGRWLALTGSFRLGVNSCVSTIRATAIGVLDYQMNDGGNTNTTTVIINKGKLNSSGSALAELPQP